MMIYLQLYSLPRSHETVRLVEGSVGQDRRSCRLVFRRSNVKLMVGLYVKSINILPVDTNVRSYPAIPTD
jgi:hypothetical protein